MKSLLPSLGISGTPMDTFNVIAGLASILGLVITLWVFYRVGEIQEDFARLVRLPVYRKKLLGSIKNLRQHQEQKDSDRTREELIICLSRLNDLHLHLKSWRAKTVVEIIVGITDLLREPDNDLWNKSGLTIARVSGLCDSIDNLLGEMKWKGNNAR
jgi:hypothetical protein